MIKDTRTDWYSLDYFLRLYTVDYDKIGNTDNDL